MARDEFEAEELEGVEELRHRLKEVMKPEIYEDTRMIIRFLRARNHNVNAAESMLRKHLNWREIHKVDTIFSWYIPNEITEKYITFTRIGHDKDGDIVVYLDVGNLDSRGIVNSVKTSEILNFVMYTLETDLKQMKEEQDKTKYKQKKVSTILNMENYTIMQATHKPNLDCGTKIFAMYEANYPELLKTAYAINASWYFKLAFAVVKPFLADVTIQKFKIFNEEGWKEELLTHIDADVLPVSLGGNRTYPDLEDPLKCKQIKYGNKVPESLYTINIKKQFCKEPGVKKIVINRLSKQQVEIYVLHPDACIEWEFQRKRNDITVSLHYKEKQHSNSETEEVMPKQRWNASTSSENGYYKCEKAGLYYLEFDNTYSWIHQKEVYYRVIITSPQSQNSS